jgi:hypothetical protein
METIAVGNLQEIEALILDHKESQSDLHYTDRYYNN